MAPRTTQPKIDVPVQRLAEFVPATFTACDENENNPLNSPDARWYKTGEDAISLVLDNGVQSIVLELKASAICALAQRALTMSECNIDDLLGLA